jgi:hypothetical protein
MLKKICKKVWLKIVSIAPKDKTANIMFYVFGGLSIGAVAYCWISHFLSNL